MAGMNGGSWSRRVLYIAIPKNIDDFRRYLDKKQQEWIDLQTKFTHLLQITPPMYPPFQMYWRGNLDRIFTTPWARYLRIYCFCLARTDSVHPDWPDQETMVKNVLDELRVGTEGALKWTCGRGYFDHSKPRHATGNFLRSTLVAKEKNQLRLVYEPARVFWEQVLIQVVTNLSEKRTPT